MAIKKKQTSNKQEVQNAVKTLFANIRFMSPDSPVRTILVTSSVPNEGKSTCSVELCRAIATSGKTVLLVEGDMRRRSVATMLNVHPPGGIYAVLTDSMPLSKAVIQTTTPNLYLLDVEPNIPNPADIISSKRFHKLSVLLEDSYDYVVYDSPPVGTFIDAAILSTMVDGVVVVVRPGSTRRAELLDAYDQLQKADANVLGVCATFCEGGGAEYYYAYYTSTGQRVTNNDNLLALQQGERPRILPRSIRSRQAVYGGFRRNRIPNSFDEQIVPEHADRHGSATHPFSGGHRSAPLNRSGKGAAVDSGANNERGM